MARSNQPVVRSAEQQKKFDAVKEHYKMLIAGQVPAIGGFSLKKQPVQHHALGIKGGGTFLQPEKVNTAWYRVDNSVRKSKWKCLGHYDEDGLDEDGDKVYDGADSEEAKEAKKKRKAYRRGKEAQEAKAVAAAKAATKSKGKNLLASEVGAWADE
jgi:hypothetical protein